MVRTILAFMPRFRRTEHDRIRRKGASRSTLFPVMGMIELIISYKRRDEKEGIWLSGKASALHLWLAEGPGFDPPCLQLISE